jgi:hypothetical protein
MGEKTNLGGRLGKVDERDGEGGKEKERLWTIGRGGRIRKRRERRILR